MSLRGFPIIAGFFSKDLLLEALIREGMRAVCLVLMLFLSFLTVCYRWRLIKCLFSFKEIEVTTYVGEPKAAFLCTFVLGVGRVLGSTGVQIKIIEVNGLALVRRKDKILLSAIVIMGAVVFSFITPNYYIRITEAKEALRTMIFFSLVRGSPISKGFLKICIECGPAAEVGLEYFFGEGMVRRSIKKRSVVRGVPLHWGAWGFFVYYGALIARLFLLVV